MNGGSEAAFTNSFFSSSTTKHKYIVIAVCAGGDMRISMGWAGITINKK